MAHHHESKSSPLFGVAHSACFSAVELYGLAAVVLSHLSLSPNMTYSNIRQNTSGKHCVGNMIQLCFRGGIVSQAWTATNKAG